jgi:hypothetical protein
MIKLVDLFESDILQEYSEKVIKDMVAIFQKEDSSVTDQDARDVIQKFERIKDQIPKKLASGQIVLSKKFTEKNPVTGKAPLDSRMIQNYTWKDLEALFDAYGQTGAEKKAAAKQSGKGFYTVQDADLVKVQGVKQIYNTSELKIYEGSTAGSCVKLTYAFKYKNQKDEEKNYDFCIGTIGAGNRYYNYRFGKGGHFASFYFVVDPTQSADMKPSDNGIEDKEAFINWYHLFIIHAYDNGKYGVTDATNKYGYQHELNGNNQGVSWDEVGEFMKKYGGESGAKAWNKIKNHQDLFQYVPPNDEESEIAFSTERALPFDQFKKLSKTGKMSYIQNQAGKSSAFTKEMFDSLDPHLKFQAINSGFVPSFNLIKDSQGLLRTYTKYKYTRSMDAYRKAMEEAGNDDRARSRAFNNLEMLPLPFVKYLTPAEQEEYLSDVKAATTFQLVEKYFGEEATKKYVEDTAKALNYLPKEAIKYIDNPELIRIYQLYSKLTSNWEFGKDTNLSDEQLENMTKMPEQDVRAVPMTYSQWAELSSEEKATAVNLVKKFNGNSEYAELLYALPFVVTKDGVDYVLLPSTASSSDFYTDWVLTDKNGKIVKGDIKGDKSSIEGEDLEGVGSQFVGDYQRVVPANKAKFNGKSFDAGLDEHQVNKFKKLAGLK